ncbi:hypothetical protein ONV78_25190 [Hahella sp. CR1]|uniref:hypothetical protein n=1 Tax=Hahella sp. CR1 TaxID=2992807 RepID=UPI002441044C|nr:hypothetical protein [Hahella sp. CR1]MDG9671061.1 hypothetical protein [Hahella sp. CR1]
MLAFLLGALITILLGRVTAYLVSRVGKEIRHSNQELSVNEDWRRFIGGNEGGYILGCLERILFYCVLWDDKPIVVGGWLAFKVASKWQVWANVISLPESIDGLSDIDLKVAKRIWGNELMATFLVGTLSNLVIALLGVKAGKSFQEIVSSIVEFIFSFFI